MFNKFIVPSIAIAGIALTIYSVRAQSSPAVITTSPLVEPVRSPYLNTVSGSGLVEASSENIRISPSIAGVVAEVFVQPRDWVEKGTPLFRIDDREYRAERLIRESELKLAESQLSTLMAQPRQEDVPIAEAERDAAAAMAENARSEARRAAELLPGDAIDAQTEESLRREATRAEAHLQLAEAQLVKLLAGAWEPEVEEAQAAVMQAKARLAAVDVDLERLIVRAPISGEVLSSTVRPGQYAALGTQEELMTLGETKTLRLRVDIDENDAWRVNPDSEATAFLRGNPDINAPVQFFRIEPSVVPKKSLTGSNSERTDTRVLQVLFTVPRAEFPAYVGQLVDVRISASPVSAQSTKQPTGGKS
ncbi:MAG: HlyD family efflux transporter periplasmic adaptor subunit [Candidatus Sumerlaeia bacterium]|nr:HlyD family efflux transporter periplasmic adaptor subunit [Candidatus Sumerlaeia bacterium]